MVISDAISVIIGIIFIWMLLGVAVMQIQEWTVGWLSLRSDSLEDAIRGMLLAPKPRHGPWGRLWEQLQQRSWMRWLTGQAPALPPGLVQVFYRHPLIQSLEQDRARPSYIPADTFALVLLDTVMAAGLEAPAIAHALTELQAQWPATASVEITRRLEQLVTLAGQAVHAPEHLPALRTELQAFQSAVDALESGEEPLLLEMVASVLRSQFPRDAAGVMALVEQGAATLLAESPLLQQRLEVLIQQAVLGATDARQQLLLLRRQAEQWFDDTMDHVTGWYKRNRQWGAFAVGLVLAAILNLDSVQIATTLWRQPALREAVATAAGQAIEAPAGAAEGDPTAADPAAAVAQVEEALTALAFPVGWQFGPVPDYDPEEQACRLLLARPEDARGLAWNGQCLRWEDAPRRWGILTKLVGIIITAAAAMQGAPFWFDILDKIVPIRAAGVRPEDREPRARQSARPTP